MSEVDKPFEIPSHWRWHRLDQVGEIHSGSTPSTKEDDNFGGDIPWLTPGDLSDYNGKFVSHGERNLTQKGLESCSAKLLPKGAVLFSSRAPIGYTVIAQNPISTNQGFKNLVPGDGVDNEFAYHYLKGSTGLAKSYASGTTFSELSATRFAQIPIPVPPISEQRRIVAKIEELFTNLDAGRSDLQAAEQQLERYRLSVLQAAIEGRLTADWRRTHDPEPADQLLERIQMEKKRLYDSGEIRKPKDRPAPEEDEIPFDVPESWTWIRITELMYNWRSGLERRNSDQDPDREYPYIKMGDITNDGRLTLDSVTCVDAEEEDVEKYKLSKGDFLFNVRNSKKLVGKSCVFDVESEETYLFNNNILRVDFGEKVSSKYINYWFCSAAGRDMLEELKSSTTNVAAIYHKDFFTCVVPLPPLAEQKQIVDEVERLLSVADDAAATADREQTRAERLRQSILKQAFSGQLVPHDDGASSPTVDGTTSETTDTASQNDGDREVEDLLGSTDPDKQIEMDL
ncbi:restriction endonuclease subunit S [Salinibacter sp.]|uniref:restriction endonuclease subunit S n=1 Tax=Salinibacter sp. TaxID=2065818 RepID=UPI0021E730A9|nr:restriction endonuclease subunit S [Salinibacter sp.]